MANELNKGEYEELKRCFQFICDRLKWVITFRKTTIDGRQSIIPAKSAFPKSKSKYYNGIAYTHRLRHYNYLPEVKNVAPTRKDRNRFLMTDDIQFVPKNLQFYPGGAENIKISWTHVVNDVDTIWEDFLVDLKHANILSAITTVDCCSIWRDDAELAKLEILRRLKAIITDPSYVIFTKCTESGDERTLYLEYLENPIPKFDTLEDLRIKIDLMRVRKVEKKFKIPEGMSMFLYT